MNNSEVSWSYNITYSVSRTKVPLVSSLLFMYHNPQLPRHLLRCPVICLPIRLPSWPPFRSSTIVQPHNLLVNLDLSQRSRPTRSSFSVIDTPDLPVPTASRVTKQRQVHCSVTIPSFTLVPEHSERLVGEEELLPGSREFREIIRSVHPFIYLGKSDGPLVNPKLS